MDLQTRFRPAWLQCPLLSLPALPSPVQEQALRKAAELQQQAAESAKEGLAGARLVAADIARGDAKRASDRVGSWAHRASVSAGMLYVARLLVSAGWGSALGRGAWGEGQDARQGLQRGGSLGEPAGALIPCRCRC